MFAFSLLIKTLRIPGSKANISSNHCISMPIRCWGHSTTLASLAWENSCLRFSLKTYLSTTIWKKLNKVMFHSASIAANISHIRKRHLPNGHNVKPVFFSQTWTDQECTGQTGTMSLHHLLSCCTCQCALHAVYVHTTSVASTSSGLSQPSLMCAAKLGKQQNICHLLLLTIYSECRWPSVLHMTWQ